jgi:hypothetical protein
VDLDAEDLDLQMQLKNFRVADCKLATTYNTLEDLRIIDLEVMESDCKETLELIKRIKEKL